MDLVPFKPDASGHFTSAVTGEYFRTARSKNKWYEVRLTTRDSIVIHTVRRSRKTPQVHICFYPPFTWIHGLPDYEARALSIAESIGYSVDELTLSRVDLCCDTEIPTHIITAGTRTGTHNRGRHVEPKRYWDNGPGAPYTGFWRSSQSFVAGAYFKSLREARKSHCKQRFFKETWNAFRVAGCDIYRTEMRANSRGLKEQGMRSLSCLTATEMMAHWQWMTDQYFRFESAPGIVAPAWREIQNAEWAGDAHLLRAALEHQDHPPYIEVDDDYDLSFELATRSRGFSADMPQSV